MTILETPTNTTTLVDTGELHSGPAAGTATIFSVTAGQRRVTYAAVDGLAVFEGDIVLGALEEVQTPEDLEGIGTTGTLWLNATIPFEIDDALTDQRRVTDAIAHWHANTHLRFTPRSAQADFVRFVPSDATRSRVGRQGGRQDIEVSADAPTGSVIHEMGHTIGLWHEQSREDRNTFIDVRFDNIIPGEAHNFDQHITDGDDIGAYDFGSIMHYPRNAFSSNGQDTIVPRKELPPGVVMGQRNGLSAGDIAAVRALYPTGLWHPNSPGFAHSIQVGFRTSLTSWVTPTDNVQHIAYVGTDQKIQELFFRLGGDGQWHPNSPGFAHGIAVAPGTSPTSWVTPTDNVQHIAYVGTDQKIQELFFRLGGDGQWHPNSPGFAHGIAVAPGTSPTSWVTPTDNVQHIAYVGTDQKIQELFFRLGE